MSRRGSKARIREFLRSNVGRVVTSGQIREAAGLHVTEWARRVRELRNDEGWPIVTHNDDGALKPGEYKLVSEPPVHDAYRFTRPISTRVRAQVLERNGYTCQMCGAGAGDDDDLNPARKVRLHIGHVVDHSHEGCHRTTTPKIRTSFWEEKFKVNVARDSKKLADLHRLGWDVLIVWECETKDKSKLEYRFVDFFCLRWTKSENKRNIKLRPINDDSRVEVLSIAARPFIYILIFVSRGVNMATGITKREQHSLDAISALDFYKEPTPLPDGGARITLTYQNKASVEDIIKTFPRCFVQIEKSTEHSLQEIPYNAFVLDDNFFVLNKLLRENKKATLIYLDPPYGTGFDFHTRGLEHAYKDKMGQAVYLEFMRRRLILMRECMADDGSIYVHIGYQMLAHLKVFMDEIFGVDNFRNLITRRKCNSKNFTRKKYANINDYILFYSKSRKYKWNQPGIEPEQAWIEREYPEV